MARLRRVPEILSLACRTKTCGHPCANKDARQPEPQRALTHEGSPLHTILPHLEVATILAVRHASFGRPLAVARLAAQAAGGVALLVLVIVVAVLAAIASAVRGLVALLSEFMRLAGMVMSAFIIMVLAVLATVALLVHH